MPRAQRMTFATQRLLTVGDRVVVAVPDRYLLLASLLVYGLPLTGLLGGALARAPLELPASVVPLAHGVAHLEDERPALAVHAARERSGDVDEPFWYAARAKKRLTPKPPCPVCG